MSTERPLRHTATLKQIKPGPFRMWIPSVAERVQCWRKARSGPIAVPKEMQPTAMPRNFQVLRLRSLAQRGRAVFLPSTTRHYDYAYIRSLQFLVRCPPEIAWQILGYWRCHYPAETDMIDQLGYR